MADDGENWSGVQMALRGPMARRQQLNYQMGLGLAGPDAVYPGTVTPEPIGEESGQSQARFKLSNFT